MTVEDTLPRGPFHSLLLPWGLGRWGHPSPGSPATPAGLGALGGAGH